MGGAVSAGENNDELIDNLVEAEYIKSQDVERIFRAVDRGDYYLEECKENAYQDLAWKHGHIHMSAPCIYSEVMESLKLAPGMSFLNLGSGTGYLSTMAGLILGTYGTNHGIELYEEVVDYANLKLSEFQNTSPAMDKYEFCPPNFVVGNCLLLDSSIHQYDRVYCGASCPTEHGNYMRNLVRVGGILVMPFNDHLLQVTRLSETTYDVKTILPVSFASLVPPNPKENLISVKLPESQPLTLQEICRSVIRIILRQNVELENPSLVEKKRIITPKGRQRERIDFKRIVIPIFNSPQHSNNNNIADPSDLDPEDHDIGVEEEDLSEEASFMRNNIILDLSVKQIKEVMEVESDSKQPSASSSEDKEAVGLQNGDASSSIETHNQDRLPEPSESSISSKSEKDKDRPRSSGVLKRSADDTEEEKSCTHSSDKSSRKHPSYRSSTFIYKRVAFSDVDSEDDDLDFEYVPRQKAENSNLSPYTHHMQQKINLLPLPPSLKLFLNFARPV